MTTTIEPTTEPAEPITITIHWPTVTVACLACGAGHAWDGSPALRKTTLDAVAFVQEHEACAAVVTPFQMTVPAAMLPTVNEDGGRDHLHGYVCDSLYRQAALQGRRIVSPLEVGTDNAPDGSVVGTVTALSVPADWKGPQ